MNVYTQRTDKNLRLCSILSAVLNRSLRNEFVDALNKKADIVNEDRIFRRENTLDHNPPARLSLVFVGPSAAIESMSRQSSKFSIGYEFDISLIPSEIDSASPARSIQQALGILE
jgi:hypothetical protein